MGKKPESYYLSAEDALSLVAKSINIKIDVDKNELERLFKQYDRNNINDTVKLKNFFLSLGLVLQEVHFNGSEDLLNESMPIILLTPDMEWMACIGGGKKFKLIEAGGQICEVSLSAERLALISAFRLQPLQKVVDGIRVINILRQALSTNKIFYSKYFFSSFFMALFALTIPVFSNLYYDKLVPSASTASLFGIVFIAALFIIFEFILRSSKDIYQSIISRKDDVDIDVSFLEAVIYNKKKDGRSMSSAFVLWHEFQKVKQVLLDTVFQRLADIPLLIIFILVIYLNVGWVVFIPIFMFLFSILIAFIHHHYTYSLIEKQKKVQKNRNVFMTEVFYSIKMIHTLNNKNLLLDWVNSSNQQSYLNLKIRKFTLFYQSMLASISSVSHISIMVIAFFMVINGSVTTGAIVSSVIVSGRISGIISHFSSMVVSLLSAEKTAKDLIAFFENDKKNKPTLQSISHCSGQISLMGVSYQYHPQSPAVISNLSLDIPAGQRVVILGDSGAGKSSLLTLLSGYISPSEGVILYDGYNLSHLSQSFFSQQLSVVTAHDVLFTGTIESNFALKAHSDRERILQALALTNCNFILQHPMGLRFPVNFMARNLSSGQQQQLLIARSLSSDASIFLWDEPTSNIDENTEKKIFENLDTFMTAKTLLTVTHRRNLIKYFDRVLVMQNGQITRDCSPEKLML